MASRPLEFALNQKLKNRRMRLAWAFLLSVVFPLAIGLPFLDAYVFKHVSALTEVPFEYGNGLLFISSILFGFTSLIIVTKEWVDKRIWTILIPSLVLIVLSGVTISNVALGAGNAVLTLLMCSATFNANVVATGFILGYVAMSLPTGKN